MLEVWMVEFVSSLAAGLGVSTLEVRPVLAVLFVSLTCGLVGSLVIGNRMAFFSDAIAHTSFAGVSIAFLAILLVTGVRSPDQAEAYFWTVPWITTATGMAVGAAIVFVRERTRQTSDTIIGVFFASSLGIAALLLPYLRGRVIADLDHVIFGQLAGVDEHDLLILLMLSTTTVIVILLKYNSFVMGSFHLPLARSRGLNVRADTYLFVLLLAMVVNLSIQAVGILLINGLLILPAAAASNFAGNLRRMFWSTLLGSLLTGMIGYSLSTRLIVDGVRPGPGGCIVLTCVAWFILSLGVKVVRRRFGLTGHDHTCCQHDQIRNDSHPH